MGSSSRASSCSMVLDPASRADVTLEVSARPAGGTMASSEVALTWAKPTTQSCFVRQPFRSQRASCRSLRKMCVDMVLERPTCSSRAAMSSPQVIRPVLFVSTEWKAWAMEPSRSSSLVLTHSMQSARSVLLQMRFERSRLPLRLKEEPGEGSCSGSRSRLRVLGLVLRARPDMALARMCDRLSTAFSMACAWSCRPGPWALATSSAASAT
mmetsp:Transcript_10618/g.31938  ORF Transcript_10618/g.31938 Transcript_10618/m.31938 type:complete len:211 (-) Transcript_10618:566-1198(-)